MPQELQLPDGRILVLPDNMTLDQRTGLQSKLAAQYPNLKTGQGMQQRATQQAASQVRGTEMEPSFWGGTADPNPAQKSFIDRMQPQALQLANDVEGVAGAVGGGSIVNAASKGLPFGLRVLGGASGAGMGAGLSSAAGGESPKDALGRAAGTTASAIPFETIGMGAGALRDRVARALPRYPSGVPMSPGKAALETAFPDPYKPNATPAQRIPAGTNYGQYLARQGEATTPGSAAKEAGYQPPVTRVPIRPTPSAPLTPEQVPGPDTPGRGNLLTPAARRGDPRAGQELMRRGRNVLYTPAEEYPGTRLQGSLSKRMGLQPGAEAGPVGEDWESQVRRRAPGPRPNEPTPQSPKEARDVEASKRREATSRAALNRKDQ